MGANPNAMLPSGVYFLGLPRFFFPGSMLNRSEDGEGDPSKPMAEKESKGFGGCCCDCGGGGAREPKGNRTADEQEEVVAEGAGIPGAELGVIMGLLA